MSEKVTWKVEAKTDNINFTDITQHVQNLSINIGKPDDVESFDIATANISLLNIDGRFDPDMSNGFFNSPTRINFAINPIPAVATPLSWSAGTVGNSPGAFIGTIPQALNIDGNIYAKDKQSADGTVFSFAEVFANNVGSYSTSGVEYFDNSEFEWAFVDPEQLGLEIKNGDSWTVSAVFLTSNIPNDLPESSFPIFPFFEINIFDDGYDVIQTYSKLLTPANKFENTYFYTFQFNQPMINPKYIRVGLGARMTGVRANPTNSPPIIEAFPTISFRNILFEKSTRLQSYFDGNMPNATWANDTNLSPSILNIGNAFDINTEVKISASGDGVYFVPKFCGFINNAQYTEDVDEYPIVNFQVTDKTAFLNNNQLSASSYQNEVLLPKALEGSDSLREYRYFPFDEMTQREEKLIYPIRPEGEFPPQKINADLEFKFLDTDDYLGFRDFGLPNSGVAVINKRAFFDRQEPIFPNLNKSTLYVASGEVDAVYDATFLGTQQGLSSSMAYGAWYKIVNIPAGGLRIFDLAIPADAEKIDFKTQFFSNLRVFVNSDGSLTFQTQRPTTGITSTQSTDINFVDISLPLHLGIIFPDMRGTPTTTTDDIYVRIFINGKLALELNRFINTQDTLKGINGILRFSAIATGSYFISDVFIQMLNPLFTDLINPDFITLFNAGINTNYKNLPNLADFVNASYPHNILTPTPRLDSSEVGDEILVQPLSTVNSVKGNLENLALESDGYAIIDYAENEPRILTRWYMNEITQKTEWIFSNDNLQPNELGFDLLTYERSNDQIINQIVVSSPFRLDPTTKEILNQPPVFAVQNLESINNFGPRGKTFNTTNVKLSVNVGYARWKVASLGYVDNKIKTIKLADGLLDETQAISNFKIGQTVIIKRTLPTSVVNINRYRITGIKWSASVDRTACELSLLDLEKEQMPLLDEAKLDELRLGF